MVCIYIVMIIKICLIGRYPCSDENKDESYNKQYDESHKDCKQSQRNSGNNSSSWIIRLEPTTNTITETQSAFEMHYYDRFECGTRSVDLHNIEEPEDRHKKAKSENNHKVNEMLLAIAI